MNLLYTEAGVDFEILKADLKVDLYFFVDSRPQSLSLYVDNSFIKTIKANLAKMKWVKVKRYEFTACSKLKQKYQCDGVLLYRNKDYEKFLYYFYSTSLPNKEDHPIYQFIQKSNVIYLSEPKSMRNVIHAITCINTPLIVIVKENFLQGSSIQLTPNEKELLQTIDCWKILDDKGKLRNSSFEEVFEKFGFETKDIE